MIREFKIAGTPVLNQDKIRQGTEVRYGVKAYCSLCISENADCDPDHVVNEQNLTLIFLFYAKRY